MVESKNINVEAEKLHEKYRDYLDFYEKKSINARVHGSTSIEEMYQVGKQLEKFEQYQKFNEESSQGNLGVLPTVALDRLAYYC